MRRYIYFRYPFNNPNGAKHIPIPIVGTGQHTTTRL